RLAQVQRANRRRLPAAADVDGGITSRLSLRERALLLRTQHREKARALAGPVVVDAPLKPGILLVLGERETARVSLAPHTRPRNRPGVVERKLARDALLAGIVERQQPRN